MKNVKGVLGEIVEKTLARVEQFERMQSYNQLLDHEASMRVPHDFERQVKSGAPSIIAEIKFASPSEGDFAIQRDPVKVAGEYLAAGARALSILTEPNYFHGSLEYLKFVREKFPKSHLLMKDFVVGSYQLALARFWGADAVLLIAALFETHELLPLLEEADSLGLSALVEVHNEEEMLSAAQAGATLIGVNNRDLETLKISLETSERLIKMAPSGVVLVAESGISVSAEIKRFSEMGYHGFLVGTSLMKTDHPGTALAKLIGDKP